MKLKLSMFFLLALLVFTNNSFAKVNVELLENGYHNISWDGQTDNVPYSVYCCPYISDKLLDESQLKLQTSLIKNHIHTTSIRTNKLSPNDNYWIYICAGDEIIDYCSYIAKEAPIFKTFNLNFTITPSFIDDYKITLLEKYVAKDIEANIATTKYGAYIDFDYPRLKKTRYYLMHTVITLPDGSTYTEVDPDFFLHVGMTTTYYNFYDFSKLFKLALTQYGKIPVGTYVMSVYFDGKYVAQNEFSLH